MLGTAGESCTVPAGIGTSPGLKSPVRHDPHSEPHKAFCSCLNIYEHRLEHVCLSCMTLILKLYQEYGTITLIIIEPSTCSILFQAPHYSDSHGQFVLLFASSTGNRVRPQTNRRKRSFSASWRNSLGLHALLPKEPCERVYVYIYTYIWAGVYPPPRIRHSRDISALSRQIPSGLQAPRHRYSLKAY